MLWTEKSNSVAVFGSRDDQRHTACYEICNKTSVAGGKESEDEDTELAVHVGIIVSDQGLA